MSHRLVFGIGLAVVMMAPATTYAATSDLKLDVMPKECVIETVNDGTTQESFLSPEECDELLHPQPKPHPGGSQGGGQGRGNQGGQDNGQGGRIVRTTDLRATGSRQNANQDGGDDGLGFSPDISVLDVIASWLNGSKTVFVASAPYAMAGVLAVAALIAVDAVVAHMVYTKWVVRKVRKPAAGIKRLVRRRGK